MKMYGIKNCQTIKKARSFLEHHGIEYAFHDFKKEGITKTLINHWLTHVNWETLLNRQGMTWRNLPATAKENINKTSAIALMVENPSIIKRPVLELNDQVIVGYDETRYNQLL